MIELQRELHELEMYCVMTSFLQAKTLEDFQHAEWMLDNLPTLTAEDRGRGDMLRRVIRQRLVNGTGGVEGHAGL